MYWHGLALRFPITVIIRTKVSKVEIGHLSTFIYCIEWTSCSINRRRPSTLRMKESGLKDRPPPPHVRDPFNAYIFGWHQKYVGSYSLHFSLKALDAVKLGELDALIWMSSPVLGLRPLQAARCVSLKVPKPRSCTFFPPAAISCSAQ